MKIFYIEHKNGNYYSTDRSRRFIRLTGRSAFKYLQEHKSGVHYFYPTTTKEDAGHQVFVEVKEESVPKIRQEINHEKYMDDIRAKSPIVCISLLDQAEGEEDLTVQDTIADETVNIEDRVIHEIELEILRRALKTLTDEELRIIYALFLGKERLSERELSRKLGIPQKTINNRKHRIFKKLENYLK